MNDYSQDGEQKFIVDFFRPTPRRFFWDIGSGDGVSHSNTRALWELGWTGILFEPSPAGFEKLSLNYRKAKSNRVVLVNCAIVPALQAKTGIQMLSECEIQEWSSLDPEWVKNWGGKQRITSRVLCIGIDYLCSILPVPDFLSIDTEGLDASILESLPDQFRPRLIMAETDKPGARERIDANMIARGYCKVWQGIGNTAYEFVKPQ